MKSPSLQFFTTNKRFITISLLFYESEGSVEKSEKHTFRYNLILSYNVCFVIQVFLSFILILISQCLFIYTRALNCAFCFSSVPTFIRFLKPWLNLNQSVNHHCVWAWLNSAQHQESKFMASSFITLNCRKKHALECENESTEILD